MPGGILGTVMSPRHSWHMCIACTPSEGAWCALPMPGHGQGGSGGDQPLGTVAPSLCPSMAGNQSLLCHQSPLDGTRQEQEAGCRDARWG